MESLSPDQDTDSDQTLSDSSTPTMPNEPFESRFKVKVTDPIKDGDVLTYTVTTIEVLLDKEHTVTREYDDFEYLHHCLLTNGNSNGIIMPPLPAKPVVEPKDAHSRSKRQLGNRSKILMGDEFHKDCRSLAKYLRLVVNHRILGMSTSLDKFLTEKQTPERVNVKKGFFGKLSTVVDEARKAHHRDVDDYFQKEREWVNDHAKITKELCDNFNKVIYAEQRLAGAYAHLSTALLLGGGVEDETAVQANQLLVRFSEALEDSKHGCDVDVANDENTLGFHIDLASRYAESLKEMLFHRTCLMVDYEEANRVLDKAKSHKRTEAEEHKLAAERAFEECSEVARRELRQYKQQRVLDFQDALIVHADAKIKTARDTYALLAKSMTYFKQLKI